MFRFSSWCKNCVFLLNLDTDVNIIDYLALSKPWQQGPWTYALYELKFEYIVQKTELYIENQGLYWRRRNFCFQSRWSYRDPIYFTTWNKANVREKKQRKEDFSRQQTTGMILERWETSKLSPKSPSVYCLERVSRPW